MKDIDQFLKGKSRGAIFAIGCLLILLIGSVDYFTTFELDIFYLLPIFIVTWYGNRKAGIGTAVFAVITWVAIDRITGQISPHWMVASWNVFVEFVFFLAAVILFSTMRRQSQQLEELATQDPLTEIANRRSFLQAMILESHRCERYGSPFTLIYIDVDNFKAVNDIQGHNAGDALLRQAALVFQQSIRDIDMVGRLGGDEFAILLPGANLEGARQTMERVQYLLLKVITNEEWPVTFSIGAVTFLKSPASIEEMIGEVDAAMYSVKRSGKNKIAYKTWPDL